ncbi:hypothetical protein F5H01DRAFT_346376 [Linnemannia elongata]|nr:hypothetical protein F5H01DRAFT_346376 [Linnemannia elongata]
MTGTQRLYRLTHNTLTRLQPPPPKALSKPHSVINLESLTRFAARILLHEYETVPLPLDDLRPKLTSKEVTKKCNLPEWEARLSGRKHPLNSSDDQEFADRDQEQEKVKELPPLPTSKAGVIYVSTTSATTGHDHERNTNNRATTTATSPPPPLEGEEGGEKITSFLFARYEPTIPELQIRLKTDLLPPPPKPSGHSLFSEEDPDALTSVPSRIQHLIEQRGVTRIWICGTDPGYRRHHQMTTNLRLLEQEVLQWKTRETRQGSEKQESGKEEGCVSGIVTTHTVPLRFPGMVQFLLKSGFKGGDRIKTSEDKVFYWKEIK